MVYRVRLGTWARPVQRGAGVGVGRVRGCASAQRTLAAAAAVATTARRALHISAVAAAANAPVAAAKAAKRSGGGGGGGGGADVVRAANPSQMAAGGDLRESITALCKNRGFVFPGSDIYGGLSGTYDYGPRGVALKKNIADLWWRDFVARRKDCVGLDSAILLHPKVWEAAGHTQNFIDPLLECKSCHTRQRADKFVESHGAVLKQPQSQLKAWLSEIDQFVAAHNLRCPACAKANTFAPAKEFNLLFSTAYGAGASPSPAAAAGSSAAAASSSAAAGSGAGGSASVTYLRPETAQGIFVNFAQIVHATRKRLPFGVGQIGKSFRNEISPRDFLFRTREFTQMELEYFCAPADAPRHFDEWVQFCVQWLQRLGMRPDSMRLRPYGAESLAHYASATTDIEFRFPFGWGELWGIANRSDFDLRTHARVSGRDLQYRDPTASGSAGSPAAAPFYPHVIEPAVGLDRLVLAFLCDAYREEVVNGEARTVLRLHPDLAPCHYAVLPLSKKPQLQALSNDLADRMRAAVAAGGSGTSTRAVETDDSGSIGKRYRRFDEIGTPYCVTVDFRSADDKTVTVRDRDSMQQQRHSIDQILARVQAGAPLFDRT